MINDTNTSAPSQKLRLNILPLELQLNSKRFSFYKEKPDGDDFIPLTEKELPHRLEAYKTLYTDFKTHQGADMSVAIPLSESPIFARHYLRHRLFEWFSSKAHFMRQGFIRDIGLYFQDKTAKNVPDGFIAFKKYELRPEIARFTEGAELLVMFKGYSVVWERPIFDYEGATTDLSRVVYKRKVYSYEDLMQKVPEADRAQVFPVLNPAMRETMGIPFPKWERTNKVKTHSERVHEFYAHFLDSEEFRKEFYPSEQGFLNIDTWNVLPEDAVQLQFGMQQKGRDPMKGLTEFGPYRVPEKSHNELFMMVHEEDANLVGNPLFERLIQGWGAGSFPGLRKFARFPVSMSPTHLRFSNKENPLPELIEFLKNHPRNPQVQYTALYISPYSKFEKDPQKWKLYYTVKETLLNYGISSQVIDRNTILKHGFHYSLPNIATSLIAKMGGIPWTLEQPAHKELVIGIGAYRPKALNETYLGSAFCFTNNGQFQSFDSFNSRSMVHLSGSFIKAIRTFREANGEVQRIVLHFYKRISRKESNLFLEALKEMKLDIPLMVVTVSKSGSTDFVLTDEQHPDYIPLSGTWVKSGTRQYLLCTNARFDAPNENIRSYPFPLKLNLQPIMQGNNKEEVLANPGEIERLLTQVYQFSRLNWRTVSSKDLPVTIIYPELVAQRFPYFEKDVLSKFGKTNLWFL